MESKKLRRTALIAIMWLLILAGLLVTATYAWFTFSPSTNVTPMSSTVSQGDTYLLIANNPGGEFARECTLVLDGEVDSLKPMSTADLSGFYVAKAQNRKGISILFANATDRVNADTMHGKVYLKCEQGDCDVYFYRSGLSLGGDAQTLAALRLGLKITTRNGMNTYIFRLDSMGDMTAVAATQTVPTAGTVVASVSEDGSAVFGVDPAIEIGDYLSTEQSPDEKEPEAGKTALCSLQTGEVATVEYWLYLEGCDENCIGEVQSKEIALQLAFAGVPVQE